MCSKPLGGEYGLAGRANLPFQLKRTQSGPLILDSGLLRQHMHAPLCWAMRPQQFCHWLDIGRPLSGKLTGKALRKAPSFLNKYKYAAPPQLKTYPASEQSRTLLQTDPFICESSSLASQSSLRLCHHDHTTAGQRREAPHHKPLPGPQRSVAAALPGPGWQKQDVEADQSDHGDRPRLPRHNTVSALNPQSSP